MIMTNKTLISQMALTVEFKVTRLPLSELSPLWELISTEILGNGEPLNYKAVCRTAPATSGLVKCITVFPNGCLDQYFVIAYRMMCCPVGYVERRALPPIICLRYIASLRINLSLKTI